MLSHDISIPNFNLKNTKNNSLRVAEVPIKILSCPEKEVIEWIANYIIKNHTPGVFIDAGAHVGIYTLTLADLFKKVYAFEPSPWQLGILKRNVERNEIKNVIVSEVALGSSHEYKTLSVMGLSGGNNTLLAPNEIGVTKPISQHRIKVLPVDVLRIQNVSLMKIDCEGYELEVLKGASQTIKKFRPMLIIEIWDKQPSRFFTINWFSAIDYTVIFPFDNYPEIAVAMPKNKVF